MPLLTCPSQPAGVQIPQRKRRCAAQRCYPSRPGCDKQTYRAKCASQLAFALRSPGFCKQPEPGPTLLTCRKPAARSMEPVHAAAIARGYPEAPQATILSNHC